MGRHGRVVAHAGWTDSGRTHRECLGGPPPGFDHIRLAAASGAEPTPNPRSDDGIHCIRLMDSLATAAFRQLTISRPSPLQPYVAAVGSLCRARYARDSPA